MFMFRGHLFKTLSREACIKFCIVFLIILSPSFLIETYQLFNLQLYKFSERVPMYPRYTFCLFLIQLSYPSLHNVLWFKLWKQLGIKEIPHLSLVVNPLVVEYFDSPVNCFSKSKFCIEMISAVVWNTLFPVHTTNFFSLWYYFFSVANWTSKTWNRFKFFWRNCQGNCWILSDMTVKKLFPYFI